MARIKGLDTLRFFAFFSIFIYHSTPYFSFGHLGVDFFFVLSSFLLTFLAYKERERSHTFSRRNFFFRRALRIFPLYYLIIAFSFFVLPTLSVYLGHQLSLPKNKTFYWLLLSNYETTDCLFYLKFLWSIAVEEQFYLLFILLSAWMKNNPIIPAVILLLVYFGLMIFGYGSNTLVYTDTIYHFPNFVIGMIGGYLYYKKHILLSFAPILAFLSYLLLLTIEHDIVFNLSLSLLFFSLIIMVIKYFDFLNKFKLFNITEYLGKYTYGLYVYSGLIFTFFSKYFLISNVLIKALVEFGFLLVVAISSYHIYEKPFLRLKKYCYGNGNGRGNSR